MKLWGEGVKIKYEKVIFFKTLSSHKRITEQKIEKKNGDYQFKKFSFINLKPISL